MESQNSVHLRNESGIESTITYIAPDQSSVRKGDVVIQLDDSQLQQERIEQSIVLSELKTDRDMAKAESKLHALEHESAIETARLRMKLATLEHKTQLGDGGKLGLEIMRAKYHLELAKRELDIAKEQDLMRRATSFVQDNKPSLELANAKTRVKHLVLQLEFLKGPQSTYYFERLKQASMQLNSDLVLINARFEVQKNQKQRALLRIQSQCDNEEEKLKNIEEQIKSCSISVPQDGFFLYAHHLRRQQSGATEPIEEGRMVRDRETIAVLPNMSRFVIKTTVGQAAISNVENGQSVSIRFEAVRDKIFKGTVSKVSTFPEPSSWHNDQKQYLVVISLDAGAQGISLGAFAKIEIETSERDQE